MRIGRIDRDAGDQLTSRSISHTVAITNTGSAGGYTQPWSIRRNAKEARKELFVANATTAVADDFANPNFYIEVVELGTDKVLPNHPWQYIFNVAASRTLDAGSLRRLISLALDYRGEAYLVEIGKTLTPLVDVEVEKIPALPGSKAPDGSPILVAEWVIKDNQGKRLGSYDWQGHPKSGMAEGRLHHIPGVYPDDPFRAYPTVEKAGISIDVSQYKRIATRAVLRNAGQPAGIMTLKGARTQEEVTSFRDRINSWLSDPNRRGQTAVITDDIEYTQLGETNTGAGWTEVGLQARDEILACWSLPLSRLGMGGSRTYENQRVELGAYYRHTIVTRWNLVLSAINKTLRREGIMLRLNVDRVQELHENADSISSRVTREWQGGIRTLNEARAAVGLEPLPDGDVLYHDWLRSKGLTEVPSQGTATGRDVVPLARTPQQRELVDPTRFIKAVDRVVDSAESDFTEWAHEKHRALWKQIVAAVTRTRADDDTPLPDGLTAGALFNADEFSDDVADEALDKLLALAEAVGGVVAAQIGDEVVSTAVDYRRLAAARVSRLVAGDAQYGGWAGELAADLDEALAAAYRNGDSVEKFARRIADMLGIDPTNPDNDTMSRARRIARTELNGVSSDVTLETLRNSRVVSGKYWFNPIDGATRPTHAEAAIRYGPGNPIPVDAKFLVGGHLMDGPHDPSAPAEEVINCRCRLVPSVMMDF